MTWPFEPFNLFSYDLIMADPPWSFENWSAAGEEKNAKAHYDCMSLADIKNLPVANLGTPNSLLWLWVTNPTLPDGIDTLRSWGFKFCTAGHWAKRTVHGKLGFGTGYVLRCAGEPFLIGTLGKPETARNVRSVIEGLAREHSRKPEEGYAAAEALMPNARRIELFGRQSRPGWDIWGNEATKFDVAASQSHNNTA